MVNYSGDKTSGQVPLPLRLSRVSSYADFLAHLSQNSNAPAERALFHSSLLSGAEAKFSLPGYCYLCDDAADFDVVRPGAVVDQQAIPNWRETMRCKSCHLNNRMRAAVHIMKTVCAPRPDASIYMTEQSTLMFRWFNRNYANVQGSEFLGDTVPRGGENEKGWRNEDITDLTFADDTFNAILSLDVLEHVPNYRAALGEFFRCLKPGASLLLSVPFVRNSERNIVRAVIEDSGIRHLLPPEYHGDPLNPEGGCLCFYHFGWELLDDLRDVGFADTNALLYWSAEYGYLGNEQIIFSATKPTPGAGPILTS